MPCADSEHINLKFAVGRIFCDKAGHCGIQIIAQQIIAPLGNSVANVLHLIGRQHDICPGDLYIVIQGRSYDCRSEEVLECILPVVDEAHATSHYLKLQDILACPGCLMCMQQSSNFACEPYMCCAYTCKVERLDCHCTHQDCQHCV